MTLGTGIAMAAMWPTIAFVAWLANGSKSDGKEEFSVFGLLVLIGIGAAVTAVDED
jgi:hypothetical protein